MFAENLEGDELPRLYNNDLETAKNYIYSLVTANRHSFYGLGRVFTLGQHSVYVSQELEQGLEWGRELFLEILYVLREDGLIFIRFFRDPEYKFTLINNWSVLDNFVGNIIAELPREHLKVCEYKDFLKSDYWKLIQRLILDRDKHTCQHCKAKSKLQVHHKTYRHRGDEIWFREDLITLCKKCHDAEHERGLLSH